MISLLFSLALLQSGIAADAAEETAAPPLALPAPPNGQVLDRMEWLEESHRLPLEEELGRLRTEHGVDIKVVVWDRRLPDGQSTEDLARRIGTDWNRGTIWGTVLLTPESINRPTVVCGGPGLGEEDQQHLDEAGRYSMSAGAMAWTDQGRLAETARILGEELTFASYGISPGESGTIAAAPPTASVQGSIGLRTLLIVGSALLVLALGVLAWLLFRNRRPAEEPTPTNCFFPAPSGRTRLGAPWSGGHSLLVTLPHPPSE